MSRAVGLSGLLLALIAGNAAGQEPILARGQNPERPSSQVPRLPIPDGLPRYDLDVRITPAACRVEARERVVFTNRSSRPATELVFHVYPRYQVPDDDRMILAKTVEMLRLSPEQAMDAKGRRLEVAAARVNGRDVAFGFDPADPTILVVPLADPVAPGGTVEAVLDFDLDLPDTWGRWGRHRGLTYLANWYPVLAHHDDRGWERTPFVPWHQPWHQEAGLFTVRVELPAGQTIASSGRIVGTQPLDDGRKLVTIEAKPARDFALVCSDELVTFERRAGSVLVKVHALPGAEVGAQRALDYACEVIPLYETWFGPYFDDEFEIAPGFFGWNGNECSGLVLLDDRVMRLSSVAERYIDHLVTHETCHQWWWNVVGTNGYAETFMDEGLVNAFTAMRLDAKYGRTAPLIVWPKGLSWLPTIGREDLRLASYYGWKRKGGTGSSIQDLKAIGNLQALFSLCYDRGGKVVEMTRNRMGEDRFFAFFRGVYAKYAWDTLHYEDLKRELDAFDPGGGWPAYLDAFLVEHQDTDWAVERVRAEAAEDWGGPRAVTIELEQKGTMREPTVVLCRCGDDEVRVPIWPERAAYDLPGGGRVEPAGANRWKVHLNAPGRVSQVEVDPDHALLDAVPGNNRWRPEPTVRLTPMVTPMDTAGQFQSYDRATIVAGTFLDQYGRGGVKAGLQRIDLWQAYAWAGYNSTLADPIFGGQFTVFNVPGPMWAGGFFYEQGLDNFYNDVQHSGGRAFLRKRLIESSSFIVDDPGFVELYYGLGNEFWPGDDGRPVGQDLNAVGLRFRMNTQFPYWDPVEGNLVDVAAEWGDTMTGAAFNYTRIFGELGAVRKLPEAWGIFPRSRFAGRVYGGWSSPGDEALFRLGGSRRMRALNLDQQEGASVWLATAEWRFPIWRSIDRDVADHIVGFNHLYGVAFLDVGQSFLQGRGSPVVLGPGVGLRLDVTLFSFLERATLRLDLAQPIFGPGSTPADRQGSDGPVFWFGLNQVF